MYGISHDPQPNQSTPSTFPQIKEHSMQLRILIVALLALAAPAAAVAEEPIKPIPAA